MSQHLRPLQQVSVPTKGQTKLRGLSPYFTTMWNCMFGIARGQCAAESHKGSVTSPRITMHFAVLYHSMPAKSRCNSEPASSETAP